jgi:hypothetical protein
VLQLATLGWDMRPETSGASAYFPFEEGQGSTVHDLYHGLRGYNLPGTIHGGALWVESVDTPGGYSPYQIQVCRASVMSRSLPLHSDAPSLGCCSVSQVVVGVKSLFSLTFPTGTVFAYFSACLAMRMRRQYELPRW